MFPACAKQSFITFGSFKTALMAPLSVVIITFNEERNIARCLESVMRVADEVVVVDSLSTDKTSDICASFGVKWIEQAFLGYVEQKILLLPRQQINTCFP